MNEIKRIDLPEVRVDFVPKADYLSPEIARLENERLWPRVWQVACRAEEIAHPGNYIVYTIVDQSVIVLRNGKGEIKAFHNACPHRGRELAEGCGSITKIHCKFHGWQWNLDGQNTRVTERGDWAGFSTLDDEGVELEQVKTGIWGGWVFVNFDPNCEPFERFIDPIPKYLDCVEFDKMRFSWRRRFVINGNWKIAIESFMESYHVETLHPQAIPLIDPRNFSSTHGKHGRHAYYWERPPGAPALASGLPMPEDLRPGAAAMGPFDGDELGVPGARTGQITERSAKALLRHLTETPADASVMEVLIRSQQYMREAAEEDGAGWAKLTPEQQSELGADWNIFPNLVLVHSQDATLIFWARPLGRDAEKCLFEMASIGRYAPGKEPIVNDKFLNDWQAEIDELPHLLSQDLSNIESIQRGLRSTSIKGGRLNPKQETQISHHHEVLHTYLEG
jgi:phenylpropionate dioxygenase-like ring-hydroxylating dioxygenase large terminal subunit